MVLKLDELARQDSDPVRLDVRRSEPQLALAGPVAAERRGIAALKYLDVVVVLIAAAPAIALGAPAFGYIVGGGGWILQRAVQTVDRHWAARLREASTQLGVHLSEAFGRIWLLAGAIIVAGVAGGRADGLTAAIVIFGAYSVAFGVRLISGPPPERSLRGGDAGAPGLQSQAPRGSSR